MKHLGVCSSFMTNVIIINIFYMISITEHKFRVHEAKSDKNVYQIQIMFTINKNHLKIHKLRFQYIYAFSEITCIKTDYFICGVDYFND